MSGEESTKSGNIKLSADSDDEDIYGNNYDFREYRGRRRRNLRNMKGV